MQKNVALCVMPKTQLSFTNVPVVPVRTRAGERRFLSATCHGAMHLFDERGRERVIEYPESDRISYSFVADLDDGFAWAVHTGGVITRIDVDAGAYDFVERVPLEILNWGACLTREGLLVCTATPGDAMVYDTRARRVLHMIRPISAKNHYGHYPRALEDGRVVVPMSTPGKEFVLLEPRTGEFHAFEPESLRDLAWFPRSVTVLADGRFAVPRARHVQMFRLPDFADAAPLAYPPGDGDWETFRDYGDGRLFAYPRGGGPLFALDARGDWQVHLDRFSPRVGRTEYIMFAARDGRSLLGLSQFGEVATWEPTGAARQVAQLDNLGHQRISDLAPGDGSTVFTTTFINSSCQVMDWRTGVGRNVRPCQDHSGQAPCAVAVDGKLWLACYGGAEINCFDPSRGGEWPENPRPVAKIEHGQMRPTALAWDGRFLWCTTHAQYGTLGGALSRTNPQTGECRVWRNLVKDHNLSSLALDRERGIVFAGTDIHADCDSAPAAEGPAAVVAFDARKEAVAWIARPLADADLLTLIGLSPDGLIVSSGYGGGEMLRLDPRDGRLAGRFAKRLSAHWTAHEFFVGPDGALYVASAPDGLFRYDLADGPRERLVEGTILKPRVRPSTQLGALSESSSRNGGRDLFFIRGNRLGVVEGLWTT